MRFANLPTLRELPSFIAEWVRDVFRTRRPRQPMNKTEDRRVLYTGAQKGDVFTVLTQDAVNAAREFDLIARPVSDDEINGWDIVPPENPQLSELLKTIACGTFTFMVNGAAVMRGMIGTSDDLDALLAAAGVDLVPGPNSRFNRVPFTGRSNIADALDYRRYGHTLAEFADAIGLPLHEAESLVPWYWGRV